MLLTTALGVGTLLPAQAEPLAWPTSIAEAAARNADLQAAHASREAARYAQRGAYSGFLPQISAGAAHTESSGSLVTAPSAYSGSVTATQNIFSGFLDSAKVEQAAGNLEVAEASYAAARAQLSLDLKSAYAGLHHAQDNVELTSKIVQRLSENVRMVELRFEGGRENKGSLLLTRATLAQARYENLQAQQSLVASQARLARVLGRADAEALSVAEPVPTTMPEPVSDFRALARETPSYRILAAQERAAAAGVVLARAAFYPSINLSSTLSREGADWFPDGSRRTLGVNVTIPIFNGGRDYNATRSSAATLTAAGFNKEGTERQLLVSLRQAHAAYVAAVEKLKVDAAYIEAAEARAQIARSKYNNGLMTFDDWDRIESDLILRQKAWLASLRDRALAEAVWEQTQGKGVIP
ncbi:MAG: TolC family protein [Gammaproteobacteria bacterium]|nr:TolC family protein [Gammaproteobacteria bacterium]